MAKPPLNTNLVVMPCGCPCSVGVDPCNCNKAAVGVQCRSRSGSYSLCGHEEFVTPSVPPKRYRVWTISGTLQRKIHSNPWACEDSHGYVIDHYVHSGAASYANQPGCPLTDNRTLVATNTIYDTNTGLTTTTTTTSHGVGAAGFGTGQPCVASYVVSKTQRIATGSGECCLNQNLAAVIATGSGSDTLSGEDTESDAIARASRSVAWSDWRSVSGSSACCASRSLRGAGQFSGAWTEAELKLTAKGAPYAQAVVEVTFTQRPLGGGAASTSKEEYTVYCGGDGTGETTISVPTAAGSEVCFSGFKQLK